MKSISIPQKVFSEVILLLRVGVVSNWGPGKSQHGVLSRHGFSSIYAAGKKGIYKIRPRSKERKRVQGGGESSSSIGKGEANANFISSLIHLEYIHCQDLETPRTDAIIINIEYPKL